MDDTTRGIGDADDLPENEGTIGDAQTPAAGVTRRAQPARGASSASGRSTAKSKRASTPDTGLDRDADIRTRELQAEIAETREELSETVEAIQEKLRPSNIMSEGTEAVKTAATERVRDMAETATDTAYRIVESTRQNPWPALMIGAGVAWLLIDQTRDDDSFESERYRSGRYRATGYGAGSRAFGRAGTAGSEVSEDWSSEGEFGGVRSYGQGIRASSGGSRPWGTDVAANTGRSLRYTTRRAKTGLQRMLHENPLLVAAAAVLTGAAVGGALPQTEKENELMGEARDQVVDRAQGVAREAADSVREVASAVQNVASQVTDSGR
jgi:hypothetical protein